MTQESEHQKLEHDLGSLDCIKYGASSGNSCIPRIETSPNFAQKLLDVGASLSSEHIPANTLDTKIHPLFDREKWHPTDFPDTEYDLMLPALQLASHFISTDTFAFDFFVRLTHAMPYRDEGDDKDHFVLADIAISPIMILETNEILHQMTKALRFFAEGSSAVPDNAAAQTHQCPNIEAPNIKNFKVEEIEDIEDFQTRLDHWQFPKDNFIAIDLSKLLIKAMVEAKDDPAWLRRTHFSLATTILHELAHAVWMFTRSNIFRNVIPGYEPRVDKTTEAPKSLEGCEELGFQWEIYMLSFSPWSAIALPDKDGKLVMTPMPYGLVVERDRNPDTFSIVSMSYINSLFSGETWKAIKFCGERGAPKFRKDGICALCTLHRKEDQVWVLEDPVKVHQRQKSRSQDSESSGRSSQDDGSRKGGTGVHVVET